MKHKVILPKLSGVKNIYRSRARSTRHPLHLIAKDDVNRQATWAIFLGLEGSIWRLFFRLPHKISAQPTPIPSQHIPEFGLWMPRYTQKFPNRCLSRVRKYKLWLEFLLD